MKVSSVMIVDDSEGDQLLTKIVIEEFDPSIEVLQAYDGKEALDILVTLSAPPDIIFLDINMPGMNGHEFLEEYNKLNQSTLKKSTLKKSTLKSSTVVLTLSSSNQEEDKRKSLQYSFVKKYIEKPVVLDLLKEITSS